MGSSVGTGSAACTSSTGRWIDSVGVGSLTAQSGEFVNREIGSAPRLLVGDARLRQLTLGFANFELSVEAGGDAAACDVQNVLPLRLRALRDVCERILTIELDVGLSDGARELESCVFLIEARRLGEISRTVQRIRLAPPEI